jgi:hypothetical protein
MSALTGTGTLHRPEIANLKRVSVTFTTPVVSGDTFVTPLAKITAAWFVPTTAATVGVDWSGKTITITLGASKAGTLYMEGY